ncbi:hypothetical protein Hanom_Chr11g01044331 [Helianthus anomalus]
MFKIRLSQTLISNTFEFDDLDVVGTHEKQYQKKVFNPLWRYIAHVRLRCMSCRRDNFEELNRRLASMLIVFAYQQEFSYSSYIFFQNKVQTKSSYRNDRWAEGSCTSLQDQCRFLFKQRNHDRNLSR